MLPPGPPERHQRILCRIISFSNRNLSDRLRHPLIRQFQKPRQHPIPLRPQPRTCLHSIQYFLKRLPRRPLINRNIKLPRVQPPQQQVHIRHRQRPPASITRRSRVRPRTLRPHPHPFILISTNRTPTRRHRLNRQRRSHQMRIPHLMLKPIRKIAVVPRHIRTRPSHVKPDDFLKAARPASRRCPRHPTRRPAQQRVHRPELLRSHQSPRARHHVNRRGGNRFLHLTQERTNHRFKI